jgi:hypothetical protein
MAIKYSVDSLRSVGCFSRPTITARGSVIFHKSQRDPGEALLMVDCRIKVFLDMQVDKSFVVAKGPFFP